MSILISLIIFGFFAYQQKDEFLRLTVPRRLALIGAYLLAVLVAFILIYYGGNWLAHQVPNAFFSKTVFVMAVILGLAAGSYVWFALGRKITEGRFPGDS